MSKTQVSFGLRTRFEHMSLTTLNEAALMPTSVTPTVPEAPVPELRTVTRPGVAMVVPNTMSDRSIIVVTVNVAFTLPSMSTPASLGTPASWLPPPFLRHLLSAAQVYPGGHLGSETAHWKSPSLIDGEKQPDTENASPPTTMVVASAAAI